jgi:hypothetical protein
MTKAPIRPDTSRAHDPQGGPDHVVRQADVVEPRQAELRKATTEVMDRATPRVEGQALSDMVVSSRRRVSG